LASAAKYKRKLSRAGQEIGPLPPPKNPARRAAAEADLLVFCRTYMTHVFTLPFSEDQIKAIRTLEKAARFGGRFAFAMPRGSGKTMFCEATSIWAICSAIQNFVVFVGATVRLANACRASVKSEFENNEMLADDFPEICIPIQRLERIPQRASGQVCDGQPTLMQWSKAELVFPTVDGSKASGAVFAVAGITGALKGLKHKRADGTVIRPGLAIPDDVQTRKSAMSVQQTEQVVRVVEGDIGYLAGPGKQIAIAMPCTVVRKGDAADQFLTPELHPDYQGFRAKMLYSLPTNEKLWSQYETILREDLQIGAGRERSTKFYVERQEAMDAGAKAGWEHLFDKDEASAIQHAMNLKIRDEEAFWAEAQNEPKDPRSNAETMLTADQIASKTNGLARGRVPMDANFLTAFVDVHESILWWMVAAWKNDFTGWVLDYGAWPDQGREYFTKGSAQRTLKAAKPGAGTEGAVYAGLESLTEILLSREWRRDDSAAFTIQRCLVDSGWNQMLVYQFCRQSIHRAVLMPSKGQGVTASQLPFSDYRRKQGESVGWNWRIPTVTNTQAVRYVLFDTNAWKTFVHARLMTAQGDRGCLSLYGEKAHDHRMLAEHLTAEYAVQTEGRGRVVQEFKQKPGSPDNEGLDALVGCAVAASMCGAAMPTQGPAARTFGAPAKRKRTSLGDMGATR
jgi:hypothetical protein